MSAHTKGCKYVGKEWREIGEGCCEPEAHAWWLFRCWLHLRDAARAVITDRAQDTIEDPVGSADRMPYCRIHSKALNELAVACGTRPPPAPPKEAEGAACQECGGEGVMFRSAESQPQCRKCGGAGLAGRGQ